MPTPDQIALPITVLEKECFGSAGCIVTFKIDPTTALAMLAPHAPTGKTLTVIYEVVGESGAQVNNFTVSETEARYDREESIRIASSDAPLAARVTQILVP